MTGKPLAISMGDPAGIGPEIIVRALAERPDIPVRIYGDRGILQRAALSLGLSRSSLSLDDRVEPVTSLAPHELEFGQPNRISAAAQVAYLQSATDAVLCGAHAGLVTAPISKAAAKSAGFAFPGHTEYLAERSGTKEFAMMLAGPTLRVTVATTHVALREVPNLLTPEKIASVTVLTARTLAFAFQVPTPKVALAGLNPHAGEEGQFGDEEARILVPALELARLRLAKEGVPATLTGPVAPDAVYRQAVHGAFDAVVAPYHDQGLIPIKLLHFDDAVNLTLGLPFVRTSPDHGTAYDIAGTGQARATSFLAAFDLAVALTQRQ